VWQVTQKNQHVILLTDAVLKQWEKSKAKEKMKPKHHLDPNLLIWKPPVFNASSRTWNW
jgi:histone acetyltransferase HTATIP